MEGEQETMTLDDAIAYYDEVAEKCRRKANIERNDYMDLKDNASEAEQLADWLNELKLLRDRIEIQHGPCDDAVSRADVVDMLEMYPFTEYGEYETAREVVKRLPPVTPKEQRWIPCHPSELPKNKMLLVTHVNDSGYRWVSEAVYDMTEWSEDISNVVAYMALNRPEPYREEGDE